LILVQVSVQKAVFPQVAVRVASRSIKLEQSVVDLLKWPLFISCLLPLVILVK